jgi:hypothetical protein
MVACYLFSGIAEPSPLFESTLPFENNLEYTSKEAFSGVLTRQLGSSEIVLGQVELSPGFYRDPAPQEKPQPTYKKAAQRKK